MGLAKSQLFDESQNQISEFAKAFAHPARVAIIQELIRRQSCICSELVDELPLSQSTISQHLKELKRIGILKGEVEGVRICYCIDEENWQRAKAVFSEIFDTLPCKSGQIGNDMEG